MPKMSQTAIAKRKYSLLKRKVLGELSFHNSHLEMGWPVYKGKVMEVAILRKRVLAANLSPQRKAALTRILNEIIRSHARANASEMGLPWNTKTQDTI